MRFKKVLWLLVLFLIPIIRVEASSFSISSSTRNVTIGSSVTIYINGSDVTGRVNVSSSNASVLSSSSNSVWIEPNGSISFKANKLGSATITVSPADLANGNGDSVSLGSKSITINVVEPAAPKSADNSLKDLSIEGATMYPDFEEGTTEYSTVLPKGTSSVNISATARDKEASVTGTGEKTVTEGLNVFEVIVTAANGQQKTYKLNVEIEEEPIIVNMSKMNYSIIKKAEALPQASSYYSPTTINYTYTLDGESTEIEIPAYFSEVTNYTLVGLKDEKGKIDLYIYDEAASKYTKYQELTFSQVVFYPVEVPKEKALNNVTKTTITLNDNEVEAYQYNDDSNYYLLYGVNVETGEEDWFQYDKKDNTIQKYDANAFDKLIEKNHKYLLLIYLLSAVSIILMLSLLVLINKKEKRK